MRVKIILGTYNLTEYFAIYEMRLEFFYCFVIPKIRNMLLTFLLMIGLAGILFKVVSTHDRSMEYIMRGARDVNP